jgi:hypothetical protein
MCYETKELPRRVLAVPGDGLFQGLAAGHGFAIPGIDPGEFSCLSLSKCWRRFSLRGGSGGARLVHG